MRLGRAGAALLIGLAIAGCGSGPPAPWDRFDADDLTEVRLARQDLGSGEDTEVVLLEVDAAALLLALDDAVEVEEADRRPEVGAVAYRAAFRTRSGHSWVVRMEGREVFALPAGHEDRLFKHGGLRKLMEQMIRDTTPTESDDLESVATRIKGFVERVRGAAKQARVGWAVCVFTRAGQLNPRPDGSPVEGRPGRWQAVELGGSKRVLTLDLPATVRVYPSYPNLWIGVGVDGRLQVTGLPDRKGKLHTADPERWTPFPVHFDLVLERTDAVRKLYLDVVPAEGRIDTRVAP